MAKSNKTCFSLFYIQIKYGFLTNQYVQGPMSYLYHAIYYIYYICYSHQFSYASSKGGRQPFTVVTTKPKELKFGIWSSLPVSITSSKSSSSFKGKLIK